MSYVSKENNNNSSISNKNRSKSLKNFLLLQNLTRNISPFKQFISSYRNKDNRKCPHYRLKTAQSR